MGNDMQSGLGSDNPNYTRWRAEEILLLLKPEHINELERHLGDGLKIYHSQELEGRAAEKKATVINPQKIWTTERLLLEKAAEQIAQTEQTTGKRLPNDKMFNAMKAALGRMEEEALQPAPTVQAPQPVRGLVGKISNMIGAVRRRVEMNGQLAEARIPVERE